MIRIQNLPAMVKGERDLDNVVVSLRLRGADAARFWRVMDLAKSRNAYIDRSDVLKELLSLTPPTVLTEADILFFRTGEKVQKLTPVTKTPKAELSDETKTQTKTPLRKVK